MIQTLKSQLAKGCRQIRPIDVALFCVNLTIALIVLLRGSI